jgi:hypothetical protein
MKDERLLPWRRFIWVLTGLIGIVSFGGFLVTFIEAELAIPFLIRICFLVLSLYGLALSVLSFYVVKRGRVHICKDTNVLIGVFLFHVVLMMLIFMMLNSYMHDPARGKPIIVNVGIFIFIIILVVFLRFFEKARAKIAEKSPEEDEMAELQKMINGGGKKR